MSKTIIIKRTAFKNSKNRTIDNEFFWLKIILKYHLFLNYSPVKNTRDFCVTFGL